MASNQRSQRSLARRHAVQALYQWQIGGQNLTGIEHQFLLDKEFVADGEESGEFDIDYFRELLHGVPARLGEIDNSLRPCLDRSIESVDPVERAILRVGVFELMQHPEIPYRVVINEGVEIAKILGAEQGHRFVNGVLDKVAKETRATEIAAARKNT